MLRRLLNLLDNPLVWRLSRGLLNATFGLYRRRFRQLRRWGVLEGAPSVLDVGCGIGQYAALSQGPYLGVDLNARFIASASRRHRHSDRVFRCADVSTLWRENRTYDLVLMVDFLHHLADEQAVAILREAGRLCKRQVVIFEPVKRQTNWLGQWIIDHDRGEHMRTLEELQALLDRAGLHVSRSVPLSLGPILTRGLLCQQVRVPRRREAKRVRRRIMTP
jgi:2-polyprenyl-3-methyl-5-hydroxy-6-metoxy-1,4-benzoquinol methylase